MLCVPGGGAMCQGLGKQNCRTGRRFGNDDVGGLFGGVGNLLGQLVVGLVAAGDAAEPALSRSSIS